MDKGTYEYLPRPPTGGSSPTQNQQPETGGAKKICLVCGDKALGYNFNAITCESCKAFFRRNALKQKVFKCPFREQCEITVLSRRFCQKCRLRKCLEVGMLTDLIMTARSVERANGESGGGLKIRKRRRHRDPANVSNASLCSGETGTKPLYSNGVVDSYHCGAISFMSDQFKVSPPPITSHNQYPIRYPKIETDQWHNSGQFYSCEAMPVMPEYFDYDYENKKPKCCSPETPVAETNSNNARFEHSVDERKPSLLALSDIHLENETALVPYHSSSSKSSNTGSCGDSENRRVCALSDSMLTRTKISGQRLNELDDEWAPVVKDVTDFSSGLCAFNLFRLEELLSANEIMAVPNRGPPISFADSTLATDMGEVCIRRCVQLARRIQAFRALLPADQIALLQGAATELMALRGLWVYQPQVDSWRPIGFPHRYLRLECTKTNNRIRRFYSLFPNEWRTSDPIMLCLSSIILFDPNQPNLADRESVRVQQQFYYNLLKEYLKTVFSDSGEKYWRVCQLLSILRQKVLKLMPALRVELDPQDLEIVSMTYNWRIPGAELALQDGQSNSGLTIRPMND